MAARGGVDTDPYATLELTPRATDAAIHAAYRALIRRYHPDRNGSAAAADRAQQINAAYAVLRDPQRRAEYDAYCRAHRYRAVPGAAPLAAGALSVLAAGLFLFAFYGDHGRTERSAGQPSADDARSAKSTALAVAPPTVSRPTDMEDEEAQRFVQTDVVAAATPVLPGGKARPQQPRQSDARAAPVRLPPSNEAPSVPAAAAASTAPGPSFDCGSPGSGAQRRICSTPELAFLDRRHAFFQGQSLGNADEQRRARLLATGQAFVSRRDRCRTSDCISAAYLDRIREISDIMQQPPPTP